MKDSDVQMTASCKELDLLFKKMKDLLKKMPKPKRKELPPTTCEIAAAQVEHFHKRKREVYPFRR